MKETQGKHDRWLNNCDGDKVGIEMMYQYCIQWQWRYISCAAEIFVFWYISIICYTEYTDFKSNPGGARNLCEVITNFIKIRL